MNPTSAIFQWINLGLYRVKRKIGLIDDFVWNKYHSIYREEFEGSNKKYSRNLREVPFDIVDGQIVIKAPYLPLHKNQRVIYELLLKLNPNSVLEIGCGGAHHLMSLSAIMGERVSLYGVDISPKQIEWAKRLSPDLAPCLYIEDFTNEFLDEKFLNIVDLAFTQAVTMHIHGNDRHKVFIRNMTLAATKQIVLMENWIKHMYVRDIQSLHSDGLIPWDELYIYKQDSGQQICMVVSSVELDLETLSSDKELRKYLE